MPPCQALKELRHITVLHDLEERIRVCIRTSEAHYCSCLKAPWDLSLKPFTYGFILKTFRTPNGVRARGLRG